MKISLNWIKDFIDLPEDISPDKILYDLTMTTVEVEGYESFSKSLERVTVGKITELKPHPDADKLQIAMTDVGQDEVKQIVCGGSNLSVGMLVAVGEPKSKKESGALVRWHGEGDLVELKNSKIRGIESYGMICAAEEIGLADLFPSEDEKEIADLSFTDSTPGTPVSSALELNDIIFEIDNKSLTNRPDLWGHYGMARELAAIYNLQLKPLPELSLPENSDGLNIVIEEKDLCTRYSAVLASGLKVTESPKWLTSRLAAVGQRSIDLIVDLTNYTMFTIGQPLHAFDANDIVDGEIRVRRAKKQEKLLLLDDQELTLDENALVIAGKTEPLALAGIKGGKGSGINKETKNIILEAASFNKTFTRRTALRCGLRTDSSMRFEKGLDTHFVDLGTQYFFSLLMDIQPELQLDSHQDVYIRKPEPVVVQVSEDFINRRIGKNLDISNHLERLGYTFTVSDGEYTVQVPSWRATGDVSLPEDIVEEVARLYGYDNIDFVPPVIELTEAIMQPQIGLERQIKEFLATSGGMYEVYTYPWADKMFSEACKLQQEKSLELVDPPSPDSASLVTTLIPNLLSVAKKNVHERRNFSIFEIGRVVDISDFKSNFSDKEKLPLQSKALSGLVVGENTKECFLKAKGILEALFAELSLSGLLLKENKNKSPYTVQEASLGIYFRNKQVGEVGVVSPSTVSKAGIAFVKITSFTIHLDELVVQTVKNVRFTSLPRFPKVQYDLAPLFDEGVAWEDIKSCVVKTDKLITDVSFVDEYMGKQIPAGKKSIAFTMILSKPDETLTSEQVQTVADNVLANIRKKLGGELRAE